MRGEGGPGEVRLVAFEHLRELVDLDVNKLTKSSWSQGQVIPSQVIPMPSSLAAAQCQSAPAFAGVRLEITSAQTTDIAQTVKTPVRSHVCWISVVKPYRLAPQAEPRVNVRSKTLPPPRRIEFI